MTTTRSTVLIERTPDNEFTEVVRPLATPGPDELLLAVEVAGLCGTDIQIVRGMRSETALVLGHEACCTVLDVPERWSSRFAVGDMVAINPTSPVDPDFLLGHSVDGVFASHLTVSRHALELGQVVRLPAAIDPVLAVLVEPLACAVYSWSIIERARPESLVVLGDGTVGRLVAWLAARVSGPDAALLAGRADMDSPGREAAVLESMRGRCGIVIATPRDSTARCVLAASANAGDGSVIDVIGGLDAGQDALLERVVQVRSENVCGHPPTPSTLDLDLGAVGARRRVRITGHRGVSPGHLRDAADLLVDHGRELRTLITHVITPARAVDMLNGLASTGTRDLEGRRIVKLAIDFTGRGRP